MSATGATVPRPKHFKAASGNELHSNLPVAGEAALRDRCSFKEAQLRLHNLQSLIQQGLVVDVTAAAQAVA